MNNLKDSLKIIKEKLNLYFFWSTQKISIFFSYIANLLNIFCEKYLESSAEKLGIVISKFISPFFTACFTVINYRTFCKNTAIGKTWVGSVFLIVSVIYFFLTLGLAIYQIYLGFDK